MATIRFLSSGTDRTISVPEVPGERRTLLSIAKESGVPILFNCDVGDCGACLVHVETRSTGSSPVAPLTDKEKFLLQALYLLTAADIADAEARDIPPDVRLACQYEPSDEDIVVFFESGLA